MRRLLAPCLHSQMRGERVARVRRRGVARSNIWRLRIDAKSAIASDAPLRFWATTHRTDPPPPVLNSEMAIFGPGGYVHVRSRTEKRPSSRPLLLSSRPLFAVYMPYLLSYCAGATSCPDPAVAAPPGPRLCGLCELRYGPWGVALLLLHLLLLLTGSKENLGVCHQHKHPCCCCCRRRLFLPPAAFAAAIVAALPSWWSCCSSCCPSCAHHPYVSF